jgi:hypothetical protein
VAKKKYIESPEKMKEIFAQYKKWVEANPILVEDYVGKDADRVLREKPRCLTMEGFENYVANIPEMPDTLVHYFCNTNDAYSEYLSVCSHVKREIRQNQIEGGMAGIFNPSITQRLNGLVDKKSVDGNISVQQITGMEIK